MTAQLALRKYDSRAAALLSAGGRKNSYSHCEMVVDDGCCYSSSAMDDGVRRKKIELDPLKWDLVLLPWVDTSSVIEYFEETQHFK